MISFVVYLFFLIICFVSSDGVPPCNESSALILTNYTIFKNGSLLDDESLFLYPAGFFWHSENQTFGCLCNLTKKCLKKCCPVDSFLMDVQSGCQKMSDSNDPNFTSVLYKNSELFDNPESILDYKTHSGNPCTAAYRLEPHKDPRDNFSISKSGTLLNPSLGEIHNFGFCLEYFADIDRILPLVCVTDEDVRISNQEEEQLNMSVYPYAICLSIPFLIATFFVYLIVKEFRTLHGKSLTCHVAALAIGYIFLADIQLNRIGSLSDLHCLIAAVIVQFSFLASFFWLNVMCFDLWWTFSGYRSFNGSIRERDAKKFLAYSLYAWGCPSLITIITLFVEFYPDIPKSDIKPDFGKTSCWFSGKLPIFLYFYGPISILLLMNLCMFISTTFIIIRSKREAKVLKRTGSKRHASDGERQRFFVYLKLFIVMGVNWSMEIISWSVGGPAYLWYVPDIGNALQGVLIFVIFVCKKRVLRLLNKKLCPRFQLFKEEPKAPSSRSTSVCSLGSTKNSSRISGKIRMCSVQSQPNNIHTSVEPTIHEEDRSDFAA